MLNEDFLKKSELLNLISKKIQPDSINKIMGAYEMSETSQIGHLDPNGSPKFYHTSRVCKILIKELSVFEPDLIIASLLHNILFNSKDITISIIDYNFGSYVAYLVQILTDDYSERVGEKISTIDINNLSNDSLTLILCDCLEIVRTYDFSNTLNPFQYINTIIKRYFETAKTRQDKNIDYLVIELKKEFNKLIG